MITEDYVSFETAKLLKEKGFIGNGDVGCHCGFYEQNKNYPSQINLVYDDLNNSELECNECLRFTHQMAMKWLRGVHKLFITIDWTGYENEYIWSIQCMNSGMCWESDESYILYEYACEAAILFCLEKLI